MLARGGFADVPCPVQSSLVSSLFISIRPRPESETRLLDRYLD